MPLWLIQTCQLVNKCFFILMYVVDINNAHKGLSLTSVLATFNVDGFTSCARLSPRPCFLFRSFFPLQAFYSILSFSFWLWKVPYGSDTHSDRKMWPFSSNWRSCGGWVSLGAGGSVIDPMDSGGGQACWQSCVPHSSWQLNEGHAAEHRMSFYKNNQVCRSLPSPQNSQSSS